LHHVLYVDGFLLLTVYGVIDFSDVVAHIVEGHRELKGQLNQVRSVEELLKTYL